MNVTNEVEKVVQVAVEVPRTIEVEKVVSKTVEREKVVEVERPTTVTVEVPVEVERIVQKVVPVDKIVEKIVQVPQMVERVVQVHSENTKVVEVEKIVEKIVKVEVPKAVPTTEVVIQERFKEVPTIVEKVVNVPKTVRDIQVVQQVLEKIVQITVEVPKVVEIERMVEKLVEVPKVVELEVLVPQLIKVNQVIEKLVEKIVPVNVVKEVIKEITTNNEKIVAINSGNTQVKEVEVFRDKIIEVPKVVEIPSTKNVFETQLQVVDRIEQKEIPIYSSVEKIIEVPHILEKIVERIVVMPQVVEVLKYVHEIAESDSLVGVGLDVSVQEAKYRDLYGKLKIQFDLVLTQLRQLKVRQPDLRAVIEILEAYLVEFDRLAAVQRIVKVPHDVVVEKEVMKPILVPTKDSSFLRGELALSLLVEKLILELKRVKKENPSVRFNLDDDVQLVFLSELGTPGTGLSSELAGALKTYTDGALKKFNALGGSWTRDHELMLNTILQERFTMANIIKNANLEIEKAKAISDKRLEGLRRYKQTNSVFQEKYKKLEGILNQIVSGGPSVNTVVISSLGSVMKDFSDFWNKDFATIVIEDEPIRIFGDIHGTGEDFTRLQGLYREALYNVDLLRGKLIESEKARVSTGTLQVDQSRTIDALRREIAEQQEEIKQLRSQAGVNASQVATSQHTDVELRTLKSRNSDLEAQLRTQKNDYENQIRALESKIRDNQQKIETLERQLRSASKPDDSSRVTGPVTPSSQTSFAATSTPKPATSGTTYGAQGTYSASSYTPSSTSSYGATTPTTSAAKPVGQSTSTTAGYGYGSTGTLGSTTYGATTGAGTSAVAGTGATTYTSGYGASGLTGSLSSSGSLTSSGQRVSGTAGTTGSTYTSGTSGYTYGSTGATGASGAGLSSSGTRLGATATTTTTGAAGTSTYSSSYTSSGSSGLTGSYTSGTYGSTGYTYGQRQ